MIKEYLLIPETESDINEFKNLVEIHTIRGRLLHLMSIIENIMKDYCNKSTTNLTYGQIKDLFIQELTRNRLKDKEGFYDFVEALNEINPERNAWAHGIIFYQKRFDENANNFIKLGSKQYNVRNSYFDNQIEPNFKIIIDWLNKNDLWKVSGYKIKEN